MAYLKWKELDKIRYAAIVHPVVSRGRTREVTLANLGRRPRLTSEVMWRVGYLFPKIKIDWGRIFIDLMADKTQLTEQERVRVYYYQSIPLEDRERIERARALFHFKNRQRAPRLDHPKLVEWRERLAMDSFEAVDEYLAMTPDERDGFFRDFYLDYARYFNWVPKRPSIRLPDPPAADVSPYHAILGLKGDEDVAAVKRRYRDLAKLYHPDVNRDGGDKMREINAAYRELLHLLGDGFQVPAGAED